MIAAGTMSDQENAAVTPSIFGMVTILPLVAFLNESMSPAQRGGVGAVLASVFCLAT